MTKMGLDPCDDHENGKSVHHQLFVFIRESFHRHRVLQQSEKGNNSLTQDQVNITGWVEQTNQVPKCIPELFFVLCCLIL